MNNYDQSYMQNSDYKNANMQDKVVIPIIYYDEEFRQISQYIPEVKDKYFISNYGRLFNIETGYIKRPAITGNGYFMYCLSHKDRTEAAHLVHRLVMLCFQPNPKSSELQVNHINGRKYANYIENLEWVTQSENMDHCYRNNLEINGEEHPWADMTNEQAHEVCRLLEQRIPYKEISRRVFGDESRIRAICAIKNHRNWKNVSRYYNIPVSNSNKQQFSDQELYELYQLTKENLTPREIAIKFGIPIDTYNSKEKAKVYRVIKNLKNGTAYKHIKRD